MTMERKNGANNTYKKLAVQCSADTFVVNQKIGFSASIPYVRDGENRQLLVAAKRYMQA